MIPEAVPVGGIELSMLQVLTDLPRDRLSLRRASQEARTARRPRSIPRTGLSSRLWMRRVFALRQHILPTVLPVAGLGLAAFAESKKADKLDVALKYRSP